MSRSKPVVLMLLPALDYDPTESAVIWDGLVKAGIDVQFATPDASAVDGALAAVRGSPGVQSAATTSLAMGGTSVMRVTISGDISALASALRARGFQVAVGANTLSIRK